MFPPSRCWTALPPRRWRFSPQKHGDMVRTSISRALLVRSAGPYSATERAVLMSASPRLSRKQLDRPSRALQPDVGRHRNSKVVAKRAAPISPQALAGPSRRREGSSMAAVDRSLVAAMPIFAGIAPAELDALLAQAYSARYARSTALFEQGSKAHSFFLLLHG